MDRNRQRGLTPRESEVYGLLRAGDTDKQIAEKLKLSLSTVHTHVEHVLLKCNVHSRRLLMLEDHLRPTND
jgi:DNA-binding NarL/FixJ family response regulator